MEPELRALGRRVLLLELLLAGGVVVAIAGGVPAAAAGGIQNQTVIAPFNVVDGKGQVLLTVRSSDSGGGVLYVFGKDGTPEAGVGSSVGTGIFRAFKGANTPVSIGISQSGNGLVEVQGSPQHRVLINGQEVNVAGELGKTIAQMGADTSGQGYVMVRNKAGDEMATMSSDGIGGGMYVSNATGIRARMGVKDNGKGDFCALGAPDKGACFSLLAVKTMTPY